MPRVALALWVLCLAACGQKQVVDVSGLSDGPKLVAVVHDGRLALDARRIQVTGGRLDEAFDMEVPGGAEVWILEAALDPSPRGQTIDVGLREWAPPLEPEFELEGTVLTERRRADGQAFKAMVHGDDGWSEIDPLRLERALEDATLVRRLETEPCPPPYGPLEPHVPSAPMIFAGRAGWSEKDETLGLFELDGDRLLLVGSKGLQVLEGRSLGPISLGVSDFEPTPETFHTVHRVDETAFVLTGRSNEREYLWTLELTEDGVQVELSAELGNRKLLALEWFDGRYWAANNSGDLYAAEQIAGPWDLVRRDETSESSSALLTRGPLGLAHVLSGFLALLDGQGQELWIRQAYFPTSRRMHSVRSVAWSPEQTLWMGHGRGDLSVLTSPDDVRWYNHPPARVLTCDSLGDADSVGRGWLTAKIRDVAMDDDRVLALFEFCDAVWSLRRSDGCSGLVAPQSGRPSAPSLGSSVLLVGRERLFVAGYQGRLFSAERRSGAR